jgi:hypothetical protein
VALVEIEWGNVDWIDLAQDRDTYRALVTVVMNIGFYKMLGNYPVATQLVACGVVLSSIELVTMLVKQEEELL